MFARCLLPLFGGVLLAFVFARCLLPWYLLSHLTRFFRTHLRLPCASIFRRCADAELCLFPALPFDERVFLALATPTLNY